MNGSGSRELVAVILAAGFGTRLRPLTDIRPKALCPVNNVPLIDMAIERVEHLADDVAVNASHLSEQIANHLDGRAHMSVESQPLGTGGALSALRHWIDGRDVLVQNADAWHEADLQAFADGWDGEKVRLLTVKNDQNSDFNGNLRFAGASLIPWQYISRLPSGYSSLYEQVWKPEYDQARLEFLEYEGQFIDCGTPQDYWRANMAASGGDNVVGKGATVEGTIEQCVLWPGVEVARGEHLINVVRASEKVTVVCN